MKKEERKLLKEMKTRAIAKKKELEKECESNKKRVHNKDLKLKVYKAWKKNKKITKEEIIETYPEAQEQAKSVGAWFSHWKAGRSIPTKE